MRTAPSWLYSAQHREPPYPASATIGHKAAVNEYEALIRFQYEVLRGVIEMWSRMEARIFCSLRRFVERICRCVRNSARCALATSTVRRTAPARAGTLDKSYRRQFAGTANRLKQQPRHRGRIGSNLFDNDLSFYPTTIIELPSRTCKVSSNDRSFPIEELGIRSLQCPTAICAAVNLNATSNDP